ncbi:MAG: MFS transporter [Angustibacter sp.]
MSCAARGEGYHGGQRGGYRMTAPGAPAHRRSVAGALRRAGGTLLPQTRRGRVLSLGATVDAVATGMFLAAATLYFVGFIGIPVAAVGVGLSVANICGLVSPLPLGWLADRIGARPVYLALLAVRAVGSVGYVFVTDFRGYLLVTCLLTAAARACTPLLQVIVGEFEGTRNRTRTMASLRSVNNIGLTVGFLLAGVIQAADSRAAFAALFISNGVAFIVVLLSTVRAARLPADEASHTDEDSPAEPRAPSRPAPGDQSATRPAAPVPAHTRSPYRDLRFLVFTLANAVLLLHDAILFILMPLWIVQRAGLPATVSSVLLSVNTVLTVAVQICLARMTHDVARSRRLLTAACALLVGACALFALTDHRPAAVVIIGAAVAVVLLTIGENLHAVAGWELSFRMSAVQTRTQYLSLFSLSTTAQMIVGPVLITSVVLPGGAAGWALMAALFVVGTVVTVRVTHRFEAAARRTHP